jgi:hypothetical protein
VNQAGGDVSRAGADEHQAGTELERRPDGTPVPYLRGQRHGEIVNVVDWPELAAWAGRRGVVLGGLALIAAQLIWKGFFLSHFFFRQDDIHVLELALGHGFSWSYLTFVGAGHLIPGVYAVAWAVARISLYNWALASAVSLVLLAAAGLAAFRLLRTLFGNRPAILIPLAVYLLTPLTMPDLGWWSSAIESLPLQIATFMALNAQVYYVRTGRFRHAAAAAAWLVFGLIFFEKALVLPALLFAVSSGFLIDGRWWRSAGRCLTRYWPGWALQLAVLAGYAAVLLVSLRTSSAQPGIPGTAAGTYRFVSGLVKDTFVPGAIGGPWQWFPSADAEYAYAAPPAALAWLAVIVAVAVIVASVWLRRQAWRAWAILAGWLAAADIAPVLLGRITELSPSLLGLETRYVADAAPVLAICLGLAFWPVTGHREEASPRRAASGFPAGRLVAAAVFGAFAIGSVWSVQAYLNVTTSVPDRIFMANARVAVADAPRGTVIADSRVPGALMLGIFGPYSYASRVVGPMEPPGSAARVRWVRRPAGTIDHLWVFGRDGRLHQAGVYGRASPPITTKRRCQPVVNGRVTVRFSAPAGAGARVLRVAYLASSAAAGTTMTVTYGRSAQPLQLRAGLHSAYFPVRGGADSVTVSGPAISGVCVGDMEAGILVPKASGPVIPAAF